MSLEPSDLFHHLNGTVAKFWKVFFLGGGGGFYGGFGLFFLVFIL